MVKFLIAVAFLPSLLARADATVLSQDQAAADGSDGSAVQPLVTGLAYDLQDFSILYKEQYFLLAVDEVGMPVSGETNANVLANHGRLSDSERSNHPARRVVYSAMDGSEYLPFAIKDINYRFSTQSPYYRIIDFRLGQVQSASSAGSDSLWVAEPESEVSLKMQAFEPVAADSLVSQPALAPAGKLYAELGAEAEVQVLKDDEVALDGLVSDAGFDRFIAENWQVLVDDRDSIGFDFAVPSRAQSVPMTIAPLDSKTCADKVLGGVPDTIAGEVATDYCFKLTARNWIVAQVLRPIYLTYDVDQRLSVFRGLSNIRGAKNERLRVLINYQY